MKQGITSLVHDNIHRKINENVHASLKTFSRHCYKASKIFYSSYEIGSVRDIIIIPWFVITRKRNNIRYMYMMFQKYVMTCQIIVQMIVEYSLKRHIMLLKRVSPYCC